VNLFRQRLARAPTIYNTLAPKNATTYFTTSNRVNSFAVVVSLGAG
jgi:hypothetical protein